MLAWIFYFFIFDHLFFVKLVLFAFLIAVLCHLWFWSYNHPKVALSPEGGGLSKEGGFIL